LICACLWLIAGATHIANAQTAAEDEHLIKAAFIYNFAKFTHWPDNTWKQPNDPLNLCTTGEDKLVDELERLDGKKIKEHPVSILSLKNTQTPKHCHLLYIATSENKNFKDILKSVHGEAVLTVSLLPGFTGTGGMIEFKPEKDQTRFIINLGVAREAGLILSSRLLNVADVINNEVAP
jgi:hypothetical protein